MWKGHEAQKGEKNMLRAEARPVARGSSGTIEIHARENMCVSKGAFTRRVH